MKAVELFVGGGGLGIGISRAGFDHSAVIEWNADACTTLRENQRRGVAPVSEWPEVYQGDVRAFTYTSTGGPIDLVAGGPPCQPFSLGGKHQAQRDDRDMWPEAVRAGRELRPSPFIFENVRGLVRPKFAAYFEHVVLQLAHPEMVRKHGETWEAHRARLTKHAGRTSGDLRYDVAYRVVNAADFGVPQRRQRVFIVGFRRDLGAAWSFPDATHSHAALVRSQNGGDYWDRHSVSRRQRPAQPPLDLDLDEPTTKPWITVRDALVGLPEPREGSDARGVLSHRLQPGARSYAGHTGSPLDEPAKTLKAGDHGVPGGENMLRRPDGSVRYFTVRESARLQTFPDDYDFSGAWSEAMRQIGNAVPVDLAHAMAGAVRDKLASISAGAGTIRPTGLRESQVVPRQERSSRSRSCSTSARSA